MKKRMEKLGIVLVGFLLILSLVFGWYSVCQLGEAVYADGVAARAAKHERALEVAREGRPVCERECCKEPKE